MLIAIDEFAFEPARARDFADDLDHEAAYSNRRFTCQLMLASLRASFAQGLADYSPNRDLNRRIGSAVGPSARPAADRNRRVRPGFVPAGGGVRRRHDRG